jgi:glycyl-tRNA synthetase beta subunit
VSARGRGAIRPYRTSRWNRRREFVEERLEGLLDVPVEFTRAARRSAASDIKGVADRARLLALLEPERLATIHEVYVRSARLAKGAPAAWEQAMLEDDAEKALGQALDSARPTLIGEDLAAAVTEAERLAPFINRFFEEVMVIHENEQLKHNRLGLLADVFATP